MIPPIQVQEQARLYTSSQDNAASEEQKLYRGRSKLLGPVDRLYIFIWVSVTQWEHLSKLSELYT